MEQKTVFNRCLRLLLGLAAALSVIGIFYTLSRLGLGIPCLFYRLTGLQCPGCGNTRAALALLRLDFKAALGYNMLFPLEFFYILWVAGHCAGSYLRGGRFAYRPPALWLDVLILIAVLLWGVLRNLI